MAEVDGGDIIIRIRGDASELESEIGRAQGALGDLGAGADDTSGSLGSMGKTAGQLGGALKGMNRGGINAVAAGLGMVNPQAAQLVRTLGAMRLLTGPLAIALGVLAGAFALYKHEMDRAAEAAENAKKRIEEFNDAFADQAVIAEDLRAELRLINGEIDKDGLAHEKRRIRIQAAGDGVVKAIDAQIEAQQTLIKSTEVNTRVSDEQQAGIALLRLELARLNQERADAIEATESQIDAADAIAEFHRESKDAAEGHADAQGELSDSIDKASSSLHDQLDFLDDFVDIFDTGFAGSAPAGVDELVDRINALTESEKELLSVTEQLNLEQSALDAQFARGNVTIEQYDTLTGQITDKQAELSEETLGVEDAAKASEKALKLKGVQESIEATAELSGMLTEKLGEDSKKAALTMFRISKAAGLASIAISTAVGISKTIEEYGMTPIGIAASVGVGLLGAAQAATVAATPAPAHMGDPLAPDERQVSGRRVLATEAVLDSATTRRMGGEDGLRQAMRGGGGGGGQPVQVNLTYKHLDREVARLMRSNSRTRRAVRS